VKEYTVAIIGAGNAGCALAAHLTLKGHRIRLLKTTRLIHEKNFGVIARLQGITFLKDNREEFVRLNLITRDFKSALDGADIVIITTRTVAHENLAIKISPYLDVQIVQTDTSMIEIQTVPSASHAKKKG